MSEQQQGTAAKTNHPGTKNGEESFNEEIKDYAKTTMNELLGMFGYDDEITSESVNSLEIKVPSTTNASPPLMVNPGINTIPPVSVATVTASSPGMPSLPLTVPDDTSDDTPVIVKVEGNTSVNDIIRQQNEGITSNGAAPPAAQVTSTSQTSVITQAQTNQAAPMNITMTTQSEAGQPALAPHFYAVPPAVRGLYCVVANLPLAVNQNKSAMTFKFWNCITCSEYFLQKPEVVFRVHYPHLFSGQPEWLYQAAVCLKCYHHLIATVVPQTTTIPASLAQATFTVIDCKMEEKEREGVATTSTVYTTASVDPKVVVVDSSKAERKSPVSTNGNSSLIDEHKDKSVEGNSPDVPKDLFKMDVNGNPTSQACIQGNRTSVIASKGNTPVLQENHLSVNASKGIPPSQGNYISIDTLRGNSPSRVALQGNHISRDSPNGDSPLVSSPKPEQIEISEETKNIEENISEDEESYKCYVCNMSVSVTSRHGKLRRSKFPSLFTNVPDNVGHFKVCQECFDQLNHQRDLYIKYNVPDDKRDYTSKWKKSNTAESNSPNVCFICEAALNDKEPSRPIYRSRYPSLFRGLPDHMIHVPICDKCYKKLQKVKLRFDSCQHDEATRNYIEFVNMWRAKRGLGKHPVLV